MNSPQNMIYIGIFLLVIRSVACITLDSDVDRLVNDLKVNYSRYARPPRNQKEPLTVVFTFNLFAIREFDEINDKFSVIGTTIIVWLDDRLSWDPAQYNGVETLLVDNNVFWTPPIFLINTMDDFQKIGEDPYWTVRYYATGVGVLYPGNAFSANCRSSVRNFPWDAQSCFLGFTVIGYLPNEIILKPGDDNLSKPLQYFFGDGLWDVKGRDIGVADNVVSVTYNMNRKPLWAIVNIILPIVLMALLNILVFLIPTESGERISFCLTVLLAIAVFLTLVSDSMPKSATSIAYLSYYLASVLVLSILITVATILSSKLYYADDDQEVPRCAQSLVRCLLCKKRSTSGKNKNDRRHKNNFDNQDNSTSSSHSESHRTSSITKSKSKTTALPVTKSGNIHVLVSPYAQADETRGVYALPLKGAPNQNGTQHKHPGEPKMFYQSDSLKDTEIDTLEETLTWKHVSFAIDRIFFVISCLLVTGFTTAYFIVVTR